MTETESMVERVAKAICAAEGESWRTGFFTIMSGPNFEIENHDADKLNNKWRFVARAAIEAMSFAEGGSNCPEAVRIAGEEAYAENGDARAIFNAMISAALDKALEE